METTAAYAQRPRAGRSAGPSLWRLDAYRIAIEFRRIVLTWLPLRRTELSDQIDRASISVVLNIAEGAGRTFPKDRSRHYAIARGSALECQACIDLLELEHSAPRIRDARRLIQRELWCLTGLIR